MEILLGSLEIERLLLAGTATRAPASTIGSS